MTLELETCPDAERAALRAAELVAERAAGSGAPFALALSRASDVLLAALAGRLPWGRVTVYQVDERVAPPGSEERNATALLATLPRARLRPMPVDEADLGAAAAAYARVLPERLDVVHLGLGPDGHTASLVAGDPVLDVRDRAVAVTGEHAGHRRLTLTYPTLDAARQIVWLVTGERKREALARLLARDTAIPAARIENRAQVVVADEPAAG